MSHMGLIGAAEALIVGTGLSALGMAAGITLSTAGTYGLTKASRYYAQKEKNYPHNSKEAALCKIAKWALLALGGITGISGAALVGFSVFCAIQIGSFGTLTPVAIAAGVISALALGTFVGFEVGKTIKHYRCLDNL